MHEAQKLREKRQDEAPGVCIDRTRIAVKAVINSIVSIVYLV